MANQVHVAFIDNPHAPEVYADRVSGIAFFAGNIRLTFESARVEHSALPGPVNRVVIGRLVMPLDAAENLRDLLADHISKIKAQGTTPPAPGPTKH